MTNNIAKIRAALEWGEDSVFIEALAALAELERAAKEPAAWQWNDELGIPHASAGSKKPAWITSSASDEYAKQANLRPLYATPPPAPATEWREPTAETQHARDNEIDALEQKLARAEARIAELERDAARYRWLRRRIRLTNEQMMSGAVKKCLTVRIAYSTLDRTDDPAKSYLSQDMFNADCAALDSAIDAARAGGEGEG